MPENSSPTLENKFPLVSISKLRLDLCWHVPVLVAAGLLMMSISWLKWPDLVIDFGEQAYIAWRLSEGAVLYRDIIYFYGPLSSYVHALLFKLFGPQLIVLIIFNLEWASEPTFRCTGHDLLWFPCHDISCGHIDT